MFQFILSNYIKPILLKTNEGACNCSTFYENGKRYLISRNVSYYLAHDIAMLKDGKYHTKNFLYELNNDYSLTPIKELETLNADNNCKYFGYEDIRTINWNNKNYFLCTKVYGNTDTGTMCFGEIENCTLTNIKEIKTQNRREKNWAPIENEPFNAIYSNSPGKKIDLKTNKFYDLPNNIKISGSTPIIKYNNYNIALVHVKDSRLIYYHYFVLYDKNYKIIKISKPFSFFGVKTEFCCDIKYINNNFEIFMAVNDGISYVFKLPEDMLCDIFEDKLDKNIPNYNYDDFFEDAIKINAWEVASLHSIYARKKENIKLAIEINHNKSQLHINQKALIQKTLFNNLNR